MAAGMVAAVPTAVVAAAAAVGGGVAAVAVAVFAASAAVVGSVAEAAASVGAAAPSSSLAVGVPSRAQDHVYNPTVVSAFLQFPHFRPHSGLQDSNLTPYHASSRALLNPYLSPKP